MYKFLFFLFLVLGCILSYFNLAKFYNTKKLTTWIKTKATILEAVMNKHKTKNLYQINIEYEYKVSDKVLIGKQLDFKANIWLNYDDALKKMQYYNINSKNFYIFYNSDNIEESIVYKETDKFTELHISFAISCFLLAFLFLFKLRRKKETSKSISQVIYN